MQESLLEPAQASTSNNNIEERGRPDYFERQAGHTPREKDNMAKQKKMRVYSLDSRIFEWSSEPRLYYSGLPHGLTGTFEGDLPDGTPYIAEVSYSGILESLVTEIGQIKSPSQTLKDEIARLQEENRKLRQALIVANLNNPTDPYDWDDDSLPYGPEGPLPSI